MNSNQQKVNLSSKIGVALQHHQQNRLAEAESLYRQVLEIDPENFDGLHLLGVLASQIGQNDAAVNLISKALRVNNLCAEAHINLGNILKNIGRLAEAEACYRRGLEIRPDFVAVYNYLGITLHGLGRLKEAETCYRKALEIKPDFSEVYNNLGITLRGLGRLKEAEDCYRRTLAIMPNDALAHLNLGNILRDLGRRDEAEDCYRRTLAIMPNDALAHLNLGNTLKDLNRLDEALHHYRLSLQSRNNWQETLEQLTNPLVLTTGLVLGSPDSAQVATPLSCAPPLTASQKFPLRQEGELKKQNGKKNLRIMLIYPPPWQIESPDNTHFGMPYGVPREKTERELGEDFYFIPYGLLTIAAQAKRAGYDVKVYNLSSCLWQDVVKLIAESEADVYGLSAFTANRRGMAAVAALVRQFHPHAHITAGGPFVTALPLDTLRYYREIDTVVIGEGENTFIELLESLEDGRSPTGIAGTAWRNGGEVAFGPARPRINTLDSLASPFDYFTSYIVMTSRGCPSRCTFCGSFTMWEKKLRFHSAAVCIDTFKKALARLPVPFLAIKDDTFTAHRQRTIEICDAIIENKLNFLWSCDTRVDYLDDEMLRKMRLAGCQMISFGIESGSPEILKTIGKDTTPEMALEATRAAQKYGICVRYYMMHLNRGETAETIQQSSDLIKTARPNEYFFCPLSFYPGTEEWTILSEKQQLTPDIFFRNDFTKLATSTNRNKMYDDLSLHVTCDIGSFYGFNYTVEEREAIVDRLPHLHSVHVELANAYFLAGRLDEAEAELHRAEELDFPILGIIDNQRACIALARGEVDQAIMLLERALKSYPYDIVKDNLQILKAWATVQAQDRRNPPVLNSLVYALYFRSSMPASSLPTAI